MSKRKTVLIALAILLVPLASYRNGEGAEPTFFEPGGLSAAVGRLYIADTNNHRICLADLAAGTVAVLPLGESG